MTVSKKRFFILWILCIIGSWSVLPYIYYLGTFPAAVSIWKIVLLSTVQSALLFGLICWLSLKILSKTDLQPFLLGNFLKQRLLPAIIAGISVGLIIFLFDKTVFHSSFLSGVHSPFWVGALASIYGGVNEEVLLRLFLFTLIYFLIGKCLKIDQSNRSAVLWSVNIFVALLFGIGHLPMAFKLTSPSAFEIFRVLSLNGIAGVVFGWLYWSRGLWTAMIAHFAADLVIHMILV